MDNVEIYSKGFYLESRNVGGYASILVCGDKIKRISQGYESSTSERMKLIGVIDAFKCLKRPGLYIKLFTDSDSIHKAFSWEKFHNRPDFFISRRDNMDLWKELYQYSSIHNVQCIMAFGMINRHSKKCEELARHAVACNKRKTDLQYSQFNETVYSHLGV